jgi:hypothetical protein
MFLATSMYAAKNIGDFLDSQYCEKFFFADERVYFEIKNASSKKIDFDAKKTQAY